MRGGARDLGRDVLHPVGLSHVGYPHVSDSACLTIPSFITLDSETPTLPSACFNPDKRSADFVSYVGKQRFQSARIVIPPHCESDVMEITIYPFANNSNTHKDEVPQKQTSRREETISESWAIQTLKLETIRT